MKPGDWLDKLREEVRGVDEVPPPGYVCARDIAKRYGFKDASTAGRLMRRMVATGKAHAIKIKRRTAGGAVLVKYIGPASKSKLRPHP